MHQNTKLPGAHHYRAMKAMSYKKFRQSQAAHYDSTEGKMSRDEVIKRLEAFLTQKLGEGQDFFDRYQIRES